MYQKYMFDNFVISDDETIIENNDDNATLAETALPDITSALSEESTEPTAIEAEPEANSEVVTEPNSVIEPEENIVSVAGSEVEPQIAEPREPTYTQSELDSAILQARQEGQDAGKQQAMTEIQSRQQIILDDLGAKIAEICTQEEERIKQEKQDVLEFAFQVINKLLPSLEEKVARQEVEQFLSAHFADFRQEQKLSFSFHPEMVASIAPTLSKLAEQNDFEGKIAIHKDASIGLSDCKVEWQNGGLEKNTARILNNLKTIAEQ